MEHRDRLGKGGGLSQDKISVCFPQGSGKIQSVNPPNFDSPLENLLALTADLRSPEGCPWDKEQTHLSVIPHLLEETYEVVDTIERGDDNHLREELGDLLFQITFHSQLAKERGAFGFQDVANDVFQKLVFRHPHVYGNKSGIDSGEKVP